MSSTGGSEGSLVVLSWKSVSQVFEVMFKTRAAVFYRDLDPIKHVLRVFFERLQKHSWKSVCQESS